jgi:hypothetical protein
MRESRANWGKIDKYRELIRKAERSKIQDYQVLRQKLQVKKGNLAYQRIAIEREKSQLARYNNSLT